MGGITHAVIGSNWVVHPKRGLPSSLSLHLNPFGMDARRLLRVEGRQDEHST
jgi:hypothetical protein